MKRKIIATTILILLFSSSLAFALNIERIAAAPRIWTVDDDSPADFYKIQEAVNAASLGDTVYVRSGTYHENLVVNKTLSLIGENRNTTVIDADRKGTVITVTADAVNIINFTIQEGELELGRFGIILSGSHNNVIAGNTITENAVGIYAVFSNSNTIRDNDVCSNFYAMWFYCSHQNFISGNSISGNFRGVSLDSGKNVLRNNHIVGGSYNLNVGGDLSDLVSNDIDTSNTVDGRPIYYLVNKHHMIIDPSTFPNAGYLAIINSSDVKIRDFTLSKNHDGVYLAYTTNSIVENVTVTNNFNGIMIHGSNNTVKGNVATGNSYGITSASSGNSYVYNDILDNKDGICLTGSNNRIANNIISNNSYRGIYLIRANNSVYQNEIANNYFGIIIDLYDNKIYHNNFINNTRQASLNWERATGIWDDDYPSGGNYWSDYTGTDSFSGPYQNLPGSDGIGDTLYLIASNNQDRYPLMNPLVLPIEREVGVNVGDWVLYSAYSAYSTNDPSPPIPRPPGSEIDHFRFIVRSIHDTNVTLQFTTHFEDFTQETRKLFLDIATGRGGVTMYIIGAYLRTNNSIYSELWKELKINETIPRTYLSQIREMNHLSVEYYSHRDSYIEKGSAEMFWDRSTGILTEAILETRFTHKTLNFTTYSYSHLNTLATNLWGTPPAISANIYVDPRILNLRSKRESVSVSIELLQGYDVAEVDAYTIHLNDTILINPESPIIIGDFNNNTVPDMTVEFRKSKLRELILSQNVMAGNVTLKVDGLLKTDMFKGNTIITVRMPGDINIDGKVDIKDIALAAKAFGSHPSHSRWNYTADENEDNKVDIRDIALIATSFGKTYT